MPLIFKNKFLKIGIVFLAINLLACSRQPDFKDIYRLAEKVIQELKRNLVNYM